MSGDAAVAFAKGCQLGDAVEAVAGAQNVVAVIGFGTPTSVAGQAGVKRWGGSDITVAAVRPIAKEFARAFWICSGQDTTSQLRLSVATNNDNGAAYLDANANAHGVAWANMVKLLSSDVEAANYGSQSEIFGGNNIEPDFGSVLSSATTKTWFDGYHSIAGERPLWVNPDLTGCPINVVYVANTACNNGWSVEELWYISWAASARPIPQIYRENLSDKERWYRLSKYSITRGNSKIIFPATMTQVGACAAVGCEPGVNNSINIGYDSLNNRLNQDAFTANSIFYGATDVDWSNP